MYVHSVKQMSALSRCVAPIPAQRYLTVSAGAGDCACALTCPSAPSPSVAEMHARATRESDDPRAPTIAHPRLTDRGMCPPPLERTYWYLVPPPTSQEHER